MNENNALATLPAAPAGNSISIIPRSLFAMSDAQIQRIKLLAQMYAVSAFHNQKSGLKEGDYFLIILKGVEIGIPPMGALDYISVIQGRLCLDGKGMLALINSSDLLEDIRIESSDEQATVTMKRKGRTAHTENFALVDATRMKTTMWENGTKKTIPLSQKDNYQQQARTMFKWRAIAACARIVFPDVIGGMYTIEEIGSSNGMNIIVQEDGTMEVENPATLPPVITAPPSSPTIVEKPATPKTEPTTPKTETTTPKAEAATPKTETATPTWLTVENQKKLVARAIGDKYLLAGQGWDDLLKLANADPTKYPTGQEFYKRVGSAAEQLKAGSKPAEKTCVVEEAVYDGKAITFATPDGLLKFWKGRKELAKLTGEDFAEDWGIPSWTGEEEKPETYDLGPLQITYAPVTRKGKSYLELLKAMPLPEELATPDYTEAELAAIAASTDEAEADPNDLEAFFTKDKTP